MTKPEEPPVVEQPVEASAILKPQVDAEKARQEKIIPGDTALRQWAISEATEIHYRGTTTSPVDTDAVIASAKKLLTFLTE